MDKSKLLGEFFERYGNRDNTPVLFFSPGRVNLIGEHTDYNAGYVLPCSLNFGTWLAIRKSGNETLRMESLNFPLKQSLPLSGIGKPIDGSWTNYPVGVVNEFIARGIRISGMEMLFAGDIPNGAGLSSSASIEMVMAVALNHLFSANLDTMELVKLSQHAENSFVGMNCGIMDQFAVGFGKANSALFINCGTLEYRITPFNPGKYRLIIANTNKRRGLTDSKYNERRAECERAVELLQPMREISSLTDLQISDIPMFPKFIDNDVIRRRAKHVVTENARVLMAVDRLSKGDLIAFGELMNQSHDSLKDDYEVTGFELDTLVSEARKFQGVIGSRMTGAGFGGCTVSLVESERAELFMSIVGENYKRATSLEPVFYLPEIGNGASIASWKP
jgi:galactokinase